MGEGKFRLRGAVRSLAAILFSVATVAAHGSISTRVKGFSLTEIGEHRYDAFDSGESKTEAQLIVDRLFDAGVRHVILSPRATMSDPRASYVVPMVADADSAWERDRYLRLIRYVHTRGMTVGIRPIFFVVDSLGNIPYVETLPSGETKTWWHGNIQPENPAAWFASFTYYLERYAEIARLGNVEEFTLGAELQSMTVGVGFEWPQYPYGHMDRWVTLLGGLRPRLPALCRVMYDINYTDSEVTMAPGVIEYGGEFIEWRKQIVARSHPAHASIVAFWSSLDGVGIDMYRSLATWNDVLPTEYSALVAFLRNSTDHFATQVAYSMAEIAKVTGKSQDLVLKELGYRSVDRGFIDPFNYAGNGTVNVDHQAAAYDAVLTSFSQESLRSFFRGAVFWDASVDLDRHGPFDPGFSPIGKEVTENVLRRWFGQFNSL